MAAPQLNAQQTYETTSKLWDESIVPTLCDYIKIPNMSPSFDAEWATNGYCDQAVSLLMNWVKSQNVPDLKMELVRLDGRTPLIFCEVPSTLSNSSETVLLYGHLDKQPPLTETWREGLGPYTPILSNGKLYGRGGADDGYSIFASINAIKTLKEQNIPHARMVVMIESGEESGSPDLETYMVHLKDRIGSPSLVVCLDSGCGTYDRFWLTTSLRGTVVASVKVSILTEGTHSGHASGIVPDSFRIIRQLLSRLEDEKSGEFLLPEFQVEVPKDRLEQTQRCADVLKNHVFEEFPFVKGAGPVDGSVTDLLLARTWKPVMTVTGVGGIPTIRDGGNVLRTDTSLKLSIRLPPLADPMKAAAALEKTLTENVPYGAQVEVQVEKRSMGWNAPPLAQWLEKSVENASLAYFKKPSNFIGEGGSIPFMGMLGRMFPEAQFVITGLLGPESNAHGPNEMLVVEMGKQLTCCIAQILRDHAVRNK